MLLHHLRDGVLDTQAVLQSTVDGEHGHVIHAQRAGRGRFGLLVGRAADDQHYLATGRIINHTLVNLVNRAATNLLIILGEFAAQGHRAIRAERVQQIVHRIGNAMRRLVEHDGAAFGQQRAQILHALGMLSR